MERARADTESSAPPTGDRMSAWYLTEVERLRELHGIGVGEAAKRVAEANGVKQGTVQAAIYRERRKQGVPSSRPSPAGRPLATEAVRPSELDPDLPRELVDILDSLAKNRQEADGLVKALVRWAKAQEKAVENAKDRARESVIREIKAAADKL